MQYDFKAIEHQARSLWATLDVYKVLNDSSKPKCYVLDMFPYPSGAGLHVGHPLGYIASDIYSRYKRMRGYNVLHPMGFDAFGLPAEQYALDTGQHPATTTEVNIARYKEQLNNIGFDYDWSREVRTSDPHYYKWTQWIFAKMFNSYYDTRTLKATDIAELELTFRLRGNAQHPCPGNADLHFDQDGWLSFNETERRAALMQYRLAYLDYAQVWWCEALGTVLANDEVVNGVSERGGHPVERKRMRQWFLRITALADRLLSGLDELQWSDAMKEMQRNWIGKSQGAEMSFSIADSEEKIKVYTTRPDTIYGVDFLVLAPEHELVKRITTSAKQKEVNEYIDAVRSRSERERMAEKKISGIDIGAKALHPFTQKEIPVYTAEYVLAGYGTGAIMAVPAGDERDHAFAQHFGIPITNIFDEAYDGTTAVIGKDLPLSNSEELNGLTAVEAIPKVLEQIENRKLGTPKTNYKLRDAGFSRQRYWGEPFPIVYKGDIPYLINEAEANLEAEDRELPVQLPYVRTYGPGPEGEGPLANLTEWVTVYDRRGLPLRRETNTMPGYAGSSWYFLRYMDPHDGLEFASKEATNYWRQVDLYIGGTEHAVGHLLYSRLTTKVLHDLGYLGFDEPFKQLLNQGMIQGSSRFAYRVRGTQKYVSAGLKANYETDPVRVDVSMVDGTVLNSAAFKQWRVEYNEATFELEDGKYHCGAEVEKMSKSKYNVVNPDEIVAAYGADTFRLYEMFLGPVEISKPWDTKGIEGVFRFLKKMYRLYYGEEGWQVTQESASPEMLRALHKSVKKIAEDTERFSFNTVVSQLMILVNELTDLKCTTVEILGPLSQLLSPYAPHLAEHLWKGVGAGGSVVHAPFPDWANEYVVENEKTYPVAINGKPKVLMTFALDMEEAAIKAAVLEHTDIIAKLEGKELRKFIFVKGKMINLVV